MKRKQIIRLTGLILLHELIMFIILFNYTFLSVGWHENLARNIAVFLIIFTPAVLFASYKIKSEKFDLIVIIINCLILLIVILFALIEPFVISLGSYDLFSSQRILILNPGISFAYILYISTLFILIPRLKNFNFKKIVGAFLPIIFWIILRVLFVFIKTPIFQG